MGAQLTFNDFLKLPASKKITIVEIDAPLSVTLINLQPGIWFTQLTGTGQLIEDDFGNFGFWSNQNTTYFNIQSLNVDGELFNEVSSISEVVDTEKRWFYDTDTTNMYIHFVDWNPPEVFQIVSPGAVIGFTNHIDRTSNNYYENIYYEPLIRSLPNLSKKKDTLFFGILQFLGGGISFDNTGGYFDDFATLDLYGQPVRIKLSFEGLTLAESRTVYTGKVEDFAHDFRTFKLKVADIRKLLSRKLPINSFNKTEFPSIDDKIVGIPIPIAFGPAIKAKSYKTATNTWKFADTEFNPVESGIIVYNDDDTIFSHGGTETDGTFTGTETGTEEDNKITVSFIQNVSGTGGSNGLDVISDVIENYELIPFNSFNYDLDEWNSEKGNVSSEGIWIGQGKLLSTVEIIEQICTDSQGIFDVLADGRFTFRTFQANRKPNYEISEDELLDDPSIIYDSEEFLSSAKVEYSRNLKTNNTEIFTNSDFEAEVFGR